MCLTIVFINISKREFLYKLCITKVFINISKREFLYKLCITKVFINISKREFLYKLCITTVFINISKREFLYKLCITTVFINTSKKFTFDFSPQLNYMNLILRWYKTNSVSHNFRPLRITGLLCQQSHEPASSRATRRRAAEPRAG